MENKRKNQRKSSTRNSRTSRANNQNSRDIQFKPSNTSKTKAQQQPKPQPKPQPKATSKIKKPTKTIVKKPVKKVTSVLLGLPDGELSLNEDVDPYATKIGGVPNWLLPSCPVSTHVIICKNCDEQMFLLFQGYAPLKDSPYERVIYVWGCNRQRCMKRDGR